VESYLNCTRFPPGKLTPHTASANAKRLKRPWSLALPTSPLRFRQPSFFFFFLNRRVTQRTFSRYTVGAILKSDPCARREAACLGGDGRRDTYRESAGFFGGHSGSNPDLRHPRSEKRGRGGPAERTCESSRWSFSNRMKRCKSRTRRFH